MTNEQEKEDRQVEEVCVLDIWKSPPPKKIRTFTMKAQYKGRKKPLPYVLDEGKEDD